VALRTLPEELCAAYGRMQMWVEIETRHGASGPPYPIDELRGMSQLAEGRQIV